MSTLDPATDPAITGQLAQLEARLRFNDELSRKLTDISTLYSLGLVDTNAITTALSQRPVSMIDANAPSRDTAPDLLAVDRSLTMLLEDSKRRGAEAMALHDNAVRGSTDPLAFDPYLPIRASFNNRIVRTIAGAVNLVEGLGGGKLATTLHEFAPESFRSPEQRQAAASRGESAVYELFGLPRDPIVREKFLSDFPWTSRMIGDLGAYMALSAFVPPVEALIPRVAGVFGVGARVAATRLVESVPLSGRGAVALRGGLLGGGAVLGAMTAPEGSDPYTIAERAVAGGVGLALIPSLIRSQPRGVLARSIFLAERQKAFGVGERLAAALSYSPRLTVGHALNIVAQGAALGAANASAEGKEPSAAITQGVVEGLNWLAGDLLATRTVGTLKSLAASNDAVANITAKWLEDLGLKPTTALGLGGLVKAAIPALAGAAVGGAAGGPRGAALGAVVGAGGGFALRRVRSILDASTYEKLLAQNHSALRPPEVAEITEAVIRGAVNDAITMGLPDEALPIVARDMLGNGPRLTAQELELSTRLVGVYRQLDSLLGPTEELPATSEGVKEFLTTGTQALALREQLAKVTAARTAPIRPISVLPFDRLESLVGEANLAHTTRVAEEVALENAALVNEAREGRAALISSRRATSDLLDWLAGPTTRSTLESPTASEIAAANANVPRRTLPSELAESARKRAESLAPARLSSERGGANVGALASTALGGFAGAYIGAQLNDSSHDPSYAGVAIGALIGGFTAPLVLAAASKLILKPEAVRALRLFKVPESEALTPEAAARLVGKSDTTKRDFFRMPMAQQLAHALNRISAAVERDRPPKSYPASATTDAARAAHRAALRRVDLVKTIRRYIPTHLDADSLDAYVASIRAAAAKTGYSPADTEMLVRGALKEMSTPYVRRVYPQDGDLFAKAVSAKTPFGNAASYDAIRKAIISAEILTGPDIPSHTTASQFGRRNIRAGITPGEAWKDHLAIANQENMTLEGVSSSEGFGRGLIPGAILPPERFRSLAESLISKGDSTGREVLRFFTSMMSSTSNFEADLAGRARELNVVFRGFSHDQRTQIRTLLEDGKALAASRTTWPAGFRAATEFRNLVDKLADDLGMPRQIRIEDYFPWIYSQRTIRRLIEEGRIGDDMFVPWGSRIPEYKVFRQALNRLNETPLGETLDDPLEVGMIYLYGGLRKLHLDPIAHEFNGDWFKQLATTQPHIAINAANWMLDVFGIPRGFTVTAMAMLHSAGIKLERISARIPGLSNSTFWQEFIDRYFTSAGALGSSTRAIRTVEFYAKLGGVTTSSLVNFGQLFVNSGADLPFSSILIGGGSFLGQSAIGKALEGINSIIPLPQPLLRGTAKLQFAREYGVYSEAVRKDLDRIATTIALTQGRTVGATLAAGGAGALIGSAVGGEDNRALGAATGAAIGFAASAVAPRLIRYALLAPLRALTFPFEAVEAINRGATAGAALRELKQAERYARGGVPRALVTGESLLESTAVGALAGAAAAPVFSNDDISAADGAEIGAFLGLGSGLLGKSRAASTLASVNRMRELGSFIPGFEHQARSALGSLTLDDAERWYVRQALDMSQFRFGREARPAWLRTPHGEVFGALQNFTFNQIEFVGSRWDSFLESARVARERAGGGLSGAAMAYAGGNLDMRIWRHFALLFGLAGAMTQLAGVGNVDREPAYWLSRLGFGFMPLLHYNEPARQWQIADIGKQLTGPVVNDIYKGATFAARIIGDPQARHDYIAQSNELARGIFSGLRQTESAPETIGHALDAAGLEGLAETVRALQPGASAIANPVYTLRGEKPRHRGSL